MANLNDFIANIKTDGLIRNNKFNIVMSPCKAMTESSYEGYDLRKLVLFCDSVAIPGMSMSTTQARTFGEFREMPYERLFNNVAMNFFMDNAMLIKDWFDEWMKCIINPYDRTIGYYKDYTTNIDIFVYDQSETPKSRITLFECYPKDISPITMDYANKDIMKLNVSMNYKYWHSMPILGGSAETAQTPEFQALQTAGFAGDSVTPPNSYFTQFNQYQKLYNEAYTSFENQRNNLFTDGKQLYDGAGKLFDGAKNFF